MKPQDVAHARYRLERATESLDEAELLINTGHLSAAASRLYYACFYCVSALLLTEGQASKKHSGLRALFERGWVKPRLVSVDMGRFYRRMFDHRHEADYADFITFDADQVRQWLREAVGFVEQVSSLTRERLPADGEQG